MSVCVILVEAGARVRLAAAGAGGAGRGEAGRAQGEAPLPVGRVAHPALHEGAGPGARGLQCGP